VQAIDSQRVPEDRVVRQGCGYAVLRVPGTERFFIEDMKLYRVHVVKEVYADVEVYAEDEASAQKQALQMAEACRWIANEDMGVTDIEDISPDDD